MYGTIIILLYYPAAVFQNHEHSNYDITTNNSYNSFFFFFQNLKTKLYDDCESWLQGFKLPDSFSSRTMECISTGILTQSCRTEIIQTLAALMWVHTHYPSKEAYNTVCAKLVMTNPTLADDADDDQATYVSKSVLKFLLALYTNFNFPIHSLINIYIIIYISYTIIHTNTSFLLV